MTSRFPRRPRPLAEATPPRRGGGVVAQSAAGHWLPRDLVGAELAIGDLAGALLVAAHSVQRDPAAARFAIGRVQLAQGKARAAEQSFLQALVAMPAARGLRGWIASARLLRGDAAGALTALRDDAEAPDDDRAAAARARAVAALGDLPAALALVEAALQRSADAATPADAGLRLLRARLRFDLAPEAASAALAEAAAVARDHPALGDAWLMQAQMLMMMGRFSDADRLLEQCLGLAGVAPEIALLLAEQRLRLGNIDGVGALLPLLGRVCAGRADLLRQLAALMAELGDGDGAALLAADAVALDTAAPAAAALDAAALDSTALNTVALDTASPTSATGRGLPR